MIQRTLGQNGMRYTLHAAVEKGRRANDPLIMNAPCFKDQIAMLIIQWHLNLHSNKQDQ